MNGWRKYWMGFKLAFANELVYRSNFFFGRLGEFVLFVSFIYLFHALPHGLGSYDTSRLFTYVLGASILSAILNVYGMHRMAYEIVEGDLTNYLLRPIRYFPFWVARLCSTRVLIIGFLCIQIPLLLWLFSDTPLVRPPNATALFAALFLAFGSLVLLHVFDFLAGMMAFWMYRAHGPRWMVTIFVSFLSGAYIPLDVFPSWIHQALSWTPFPSLVFVPLKAYLGDLSGVALGQAILFQWFWIAFFTLLLAFVWKRGVKGYEAYGR